MATPRTFVLDARTIARHRAGQCIALDTAAIGRAFAIVDGPPKGETRALRDSSTAKSAPGSIAVVDVLGVLEQRGDQYCGWIDGYDSIANRTIEALEDRDVAAVVMRIDSPGGDVAGIEEAIRRIVEARDREGKPLAVYVDELAASAGYWLAATLPNAGLYAPPAARVGSVGVWMPLVDERGALEQQGISLKLIRDPAGKDESNPADPIPELALERATQRVQEIAARFYSAIATARGLTPEFVRGLNADVFSAAKAQSLGLVDGIVSFEAAIHKIAADVTKQRAGAARARVHARLARQIQEKPMGKTKAAEMPAEEPKAGRATGADVAASCRECATACEDCATAAESGTADDAIAAATACMAACEATQKTLKSFLGMPEDAPIEGPKPEPAEEPMPEPEMAAAKIAASLVGKTSLVEALPALQAMRATAERAEQAKAEAARALKAIEDEQRRELVASMVRLGTETPATAWAPGADGLPDGKTPAEPWASMPVEALRARVAALSAAKPAPVEPQPPKTSQADEVPERVVDGFKRRGLSGEKLAAAVAEYRSKRAAMAARKGN